MSTSQSPISKLRLEANKVAKQMKAIAEGKVQDVHGKIAAALKRETFKATIVQDDKMLVIEIPWVTIRTWSEAGLTEFILKHMRGDRDDVD